MNIVTRTVRIYGLLDPRNNQVFYVGRTSKTLGDRLCGHIRDSQRRKSAKAQYITEILAVGLKPSIFEIALLPDATKEEASAAEGSWIQFYSLTHDLTNTGPANWGAWGPITKLNWDDQVVAMLGNVTDRKLASLLTCDVQTVALERERRGILPYSKTRAAMETFPEWEQYLGKISDEKLAKLSGIPRSTIRKLRDERGIECFRFATSVANKPWVIEKLGTMSDPELAKLAGVGETAITDLRNKLKIPDWQSSLISLPSWALEKLGTISDLKLARSAGVPEYYVATLRRRAGIESWKSKQPPLLPESEMPKLGTMSDKALADFLGIDDLVVCRARNKRGIPPYRPSK